MKIENFNRTNVKSLREQLNSELESLANRLGIDISVGNATFTSNSVTFKVNANKISEGGFIITKEAEAWNRHASRYNLNHISVGDDVFCQGKRFTLTGWNSKAKKYPIEISDSVGVKYKVSIQQFRSEN